ncbi:MAG TPA: branched-chain amino acid ABC transporter permease [Chloroflexota bacterium]|nr:branched-chain amino acid ABC transporter permease [Chloroflexota bacterium]
MTDPLVLAQVAVSGLLLGGVYALFAAGLNVIFGVMRVINLAHGELMMLGAYGTFWLFTLYGVNPLVSLLVTVPAVAALGLLLQRFVIARTVGQPLLSSLLLTFGLSTFFMGVALNLWTADFRSVAWLSGSVALGPLAFSMARTIGFVLALAITLGTYFFLRATRTGKAVRATAQQPEVAAVCGIDVARIRLITFALGAGMAAAAGSLISMMYAISPEMGRTFISKAFAIIVLGGLGSFIGSFVGAIALGEAEAFTALVADAQVAEAVAYVVLVAVLILRPSGLFGVRE